MKCIVCAIAKKENEYLYEWAKYHLDIGFSFIHIYDNNDLDGERISDVFNGTDCEDQVIVHDARGLRYVQKKVYQECYDNENFDWCAFIDIDEFITFESNSGINNINVFLNNKSGWDAIHLNWMCYGDGNLVHNNHQPVLKRFTHPKKPLGFYYTYINLQENTHIKSIIRKGLTIDWCLDTESFKSNPHTPNGLDMVCNSIGSKVPNSPFAPICFDVAFIRHFTTKTIEEYAVKTIRKCADCDSEQFYSFPKFFRLNKPSLRKMLYLKREFPTISSRRCIIEHLKFIILNYHLPFRFLFKSLNTSVDYIRP